MHKLSKLKALYQVYLNKRCEFTQKATFSVEVYRGALHVEDEEALDDIVNFRYSLEPQFDSVITYPANTENSVIEHCRELFNSSFAKAIKIVFY